MVVLDNILLFQKDPAWPWLHPAESSSPEVRTNKDNSKTVNITVKDNSKKKLMLSDAAVRIASIRGTKIVWGIQEAGNYFVFVSVIVYQLMALWKLTANWEDQKY